MTADSAVRGIREVDSEGTIGLITNEMYAPYARPPLSKSLWSGEDNVEDIDLDTSEMELEIHLGRTVKKVDLTNKKVEDDKGNEYRYQKLLIATGGTPKKFSNIKAPDIIYYRTLSDYKKLREIVDDNNNFGIIGGGFIGSEIAAGIKMYKPESRVTMLFPEDGIGGLIFPKKLSNFLNNYYQEKGIDVLSKELVVDIKKDDKIYLVETNSGKKLKFDAIIAGLGIKPNTELFIETGIEINDGI
ncbi:MAG: FAD-dependent oxidoreductase, partial [Promethearchaeota archaeon]